MSERRITVREKDMEKWIDRWIANRVTAWKMLNNITYIAIAILSLTVFHVGEYGILIFIGLTALYRAQ